MEKEQEFADEDYQTEQWVFGGLVELEGSKLGVAFTPVNADFEFTDEERVFASSRRFRSCVIAGLYEVQVARRGKRIRMIPDSVVYKGYLGNRCTEKADWWKDWRMRAEARSKAIEARFRLRRQEKNDGRHSEIEAALAPLRAEYQSTDRLGRHIIEAMVLHYLRTGESKL